MLQMLKYGFPKIMVTILGVPFIWIIDDFSALGSILGCPIYGSCQVVTNCVVLGPW